MEVLKDLRSEIDSLDRELIQLLLNVLSWFLKSVNVKHQHGLPIYAPEREIAMLKHVV